MKKVYTLNDLPLIATQILQKSNSNILLFKGKMGSGKTTLIKEIVKQLGFNGVVNSPTFSLVNHYISKNGENIYHFDFYRIEKEEEALDIGIEEYFYQNAFCFIEWPEKVENLLPLGAVEIYLTINKDNSRTIQIKKNG